MSTDLVARLDDKLRAKRESFDRIPVVDVAPLLDGSDKHGVARQIRWALSNAGFMYVKNHGIDQGFVDQTFDVTRAFFDLPMEQKMALHVSKSDVALRGYIEDPALRALHGAAGEARSKDFSWDRINQAVADTYLRLIRQKPKAQP